MKKKLFGLLLILLVAGCIQVDIKSTVEEGVETVKGKLSEELGIGEYALNIGDMVTVDGKIVRLESFNPDYVVVFDVDGKKIEMQETQDSQVVNGLELTIVKSIFDASAVEENYVKVKVVKYVPGEDEYIFYLEDGKEIAGYEIELLKLDKDGTVTVRVDMANEVRVMEGKTEPASGLYVSNLRPNHRAIASERYVILKITEKP